MSGKLAICSTRRPSSKQDRGSILNSLSVQPYLREKHQKTYAFILSGCPLRLVYALRPILIIERVPHEPDRQFSTRCSIFLSPLTGLRLGRRCPRTTQEA